MAVGAPVAVDRIEIKATATHVTESLAINANVTSRPAVGSYSYGMTLSLSTVTANMDKPRRRDCLGNHDDWTGCCFFNHNSLEIGALSGGKRATVTVNGKINNEGIVTLYATARSMRRTPTMKAIRRQ